MIANVRRGRIASGSVGSIVTLLNLIGGASPPRAHPPPHAHQPTEHAFAWSLDGFLLHAIRERTELELHGAQSQLHAGGELAFSRGARAVDERAVRRPQVDDVPRVALAQQCRMRVRDAVV